MAAFFVSLVVFLAVCALDSIECFVLIQFPGWQEHLMQRYGSLLSLLDWAELIMLLALGPLWLVLVGLALAGSSRQVPVLKRFSRNWWLLSFSYVANCLVLISIAVLMALAYM